MGRERGRERESMRYSLVCAALLLLLATTTTLARSQVDFQVGDMNVDPTQEEYGTLTSRAKGLLSYSMTGQRYTCRSTAGALASTRLRLLRTRTTRPSTLSCLRWRTSSGFPRTRT